MTPGGRSRVPAGLVGAGPWATFVHAPLLAAHPDLELRGAWARRPEAARSLVDTHGGAVITDLDELVDRCEILVFAVPPSVQAELAIPAARAGRTLLLEKPVAAELAPARRLREIVEEGGARTVLALTWRWSEPLRAFLEELESGPPPTRVTARFRSGAALGGPFATPWRRDDGALLDLGPHVLDLLMTILGPVEDLSGHRDADGAVHLRLRHVGGATSTAELSITDPGPGGSLLEVESGAGVHRVDPGAGVDPMLFTRMADTIVAVHRGGRTPFDLDRGVRLQELLDRAARTLA